VGVEQDFLEETFRLRSEFIPLCDLLKYCSVAESGGEAKYLIAEGNVLVDGDVELRKRCKIRAGQVVSGMDFEIHVVAG
jgi:ribosome-associated protein